MIEKMKNFKIILLALLAIMVIFTQTVFVPQSVSAQEAGQNKIYVTDEADIFTQKEEEKLQELCEKASAGCETDVVIMTLRTGKDYSVLDSYVRNIMNEKYGYNGTSNPPDAVVYVIDMVSRADRIVTSGKAQTDITQASLDKIREKAEKKLADGDYYAGCKKYISGIQAQLNYHISYKLMQTWPAAALCAVIASVLTVLIMMHSAKTKMTVDSRTYQNKGYRIIQREDRLLNTTVVTRTIETGSRSGGGGGGGGGGNSGSSGGHF